MPLCGTPLKISICYFFFPSLSFQPPLPPLFLLRERLHQEIQAREGGQHQVVQMEKNTSLGGKRIGKYFFSFSGLATQRRRSGARQWRTRWNSFPNEFEIDYIFFVWNKFVKILSKLFFSISPQSSDNESRLALFRKAMAKQSTLVKTEKNLFDVVLRENMLRVSFSFDASDQGEHNRSRSGHPPPGHQGGLQGAGEDESDLWRRIRDVQPVQAVDEPGELEKIVWKSVPFLVNTVLERRY